MKRMRSTPIVDKATGKITECWIQQSRKDKNIWYVRRRSGGRIHTIYKCTNMFSASYKLGRYAAKRKPTSEQEYNQFCRKCAYLQECYLENDVALCPSRCRLFVDNLSDCNEHTDCKCCEGCERSEQLFDLGEFEEYHNNEDIT